MWPPRRPIERAAEPAKADVDGIRSSCAPLREYLERLLAVRSGLGTHELSRYMGPA